MTYNEKVYEVICSLVNRYIKGVTAKVVRHNGDLLVMFEDDIKRACFSERLKNEIKTTDV